MVEKKLRAIDFKIIDDVFDMHGGYVLDFSNQTFSDFFVDEIGIDIYSSQFENGGTSKAKRLRFYLRQARPDEVVKVLSSLWEYREAIRRRSGEKEKSPHTKTELFQLIKRLGGTPPEDIISAEFQKETVAINEATASQLHNKLIEVSMMEAQPRGYAFEKLLKELFDKYGLMGRASFRLVGEQIDGSFEMNGETYLLEAKWTGLKVGAADLRSFNAKVEDKASWSRGLFVSNSGFSNDGLKAFGKSKSIICMDGFDVSEMLQNRLSFTDVLSRKVRKAAETGRPFISVRDLY